MLYQGLVHGPQHVKEQTCGALLQWNLGIGVDSARRSHIAKVNVDRHYSVSLEQLSNVEQGMRLPCSAPAIDDLVIPGGQNGNQGTQVDEGLNQGLTVYGLSSPGDPDEAGIDRVGNALFFSHEEHCIRTHERCVQLTHRSPHQKNRHQSAREHSPRWGEPARPPSHAGGPAQPGDASGIFGPMYDSATKPPRWI